MPLAILIVLALVLLSQQQPPPPSSGGYYIPAGPRSPGLQHVSPGAPGAPSTRTQIETGVGALVGGGAGAYLCGGAPTCIIAGSAVGGTVAPFVSEGGQWVGEKVGEGAVSAYKNTLGRLF